MTAEEVPVRVVRTAEREAATGPSGPADVSGYTVAGPFCTDKRVLAVTWDSGAAGVGLLAEEFAAASVSGVNVSGVPLDGLTKVFSPPNLQWKQAALDDLTGLFESGSFDVAVAVGVVQHLTEPGVLFATLRTLVHPDGHVVVSCPNDLAERSLAAAPDATEVNRFAENAFRDAAESVLGPCDLWLRGAAVDGYLNIAEVAAGQPGDAGDGSVRLVVGEGSALTGDASYFVGVWGPGDVSGHISGALRVSAESEARRLEAQHESCETTLQQAQAELGRIYLQLRAAQEEMYVIRDSVGLLVTAGSQELREAVDAQTKLIDERDEYIKVLEERVDSLSAELKDLIDATDWYRRRPKVRKTVEVVVNYRQRKNQPASDDAP
jgi:SAM-dependent methyltransferase